MSEETALASAKTFEQASLQFSQQNYAAAIESLDSVIAQGGVSPDETVEAYLLRIECRLALNDLSNAQSDLAIVEQGYTDECRFLIVKGKVLLAAGDAAGATQAFTQAKKLNPRIKIP